MESGQIFNRRCHARESLWLGEAIIQVGLNCPSHHFQADRQHSSSMSNLGWWCPQIKPSLRIVRPHHEHRSGPLDQEVREILATHRRRWMTTLSSPTIVARHPTDELRGLRGHSSWPVRPYWYSTSPSRPSRHTPGRPLAPPRNDLRLHLGIQGAHGAHELRGVRDHVSGASGVQRPDGHHGRFDRIDVSRDDGLQRRDHVGADHDRVDRRVRLRRVATLALDRRP